MFTTIQGGKVNESNTSSTHLNFPTPFPKKGDGGGPPSDWLVAGNTAWLRFGGHGSPHVGLVGPDPEKPGNWLIVYRNDWGNILRTSIETMFLSPDNSTGEGKDVPRM